MKHLAAVLVLALSLLACTSTPTPLPPNDHTGEAKMLALNSVALVEVQEEGRTEAYCSGVWVGPSTILTAAHCVIQQFDLLDTVLYAVPSDVVDERTDMVLFHAATLAAMDASHDLALLRTPSINPLHGVAHVAFGATQGQFTQTMGQSLGLWWSYSTGTLSAVRHFSHRGHVAFAKDMLWVQTTAPTSPGNSGGALFDENGDILGICHGSYTDGDSLHFFVHRDHVAAFLREQGVLQ